MPHAVVSVSQAGKKPKPEARELASDVLDVIPKHLLVRMTVSGCLDVWLRLGFTVQEQIKEVEDHIAKYPGLYDLNKH